MAFQLRPASLDDLRSVLAVIHTRQEFRQWGGPLLTFPPEVERTWNEINTRGEVTFALEHADGALAGFGQVVSLAEGQAHLARVMVLPALRGQGIGRVLCQALIAEGVTRFGAREITLNVLKDNAPALRLYTSLGFQAVGESDTGRVWKMRLLVTP